MDYEVWRSENGYSKLQAKFRLFTDALHHVVSYCSGQDARLRLPNGSWVDSATCDQMLKRSSPAPTSSGPAADAAVHQSGRRTVRREITQPVGRPASTAPPEPPIELTAENGLLEEVLRRTDLQPQADIVERVLLATLEVLHEAKRDPFAARAVRFEREPSVD